MSKQKFAEGPKGGVPPWKEGQKIDLRIAHWSLWGPRVSGMYETVRELIAAEMAIDGVMAGMVETPHYKAGTTEVQRAAMGGRTDTLHPWLRTQDWGWAMKWADIHMIHSTFSKRVGELKPKVFFAHGVPEACLASEIDEKVASFTSTADWIAKMDGAFVTSKHAEEMWGVFDYTGEKIHRVTKGIDLSWWTRAPTYQDLDGDPSILYGEIWRGIKWPLHLFYAVKRIFEENPKVRLNMWGLNIEKVFWRKIVNWARFDELLGKQGIRTIVDYPSHYYTRGDVYWGAALYGDLSRSMKESMACGCPMLTWDTDTYGDCHAYKYVKPFDIEDLAQKLTDTAEEVFDDREGVAKKCRSIAEQYYDVNDEAKQIVEVLRRIVSESKPGSKTD